MKIQKYGWRPDLPDHRDFKYSVPHHLMVSLPPVVDMRNVMPAVYDQGDLGSCTAHGTSAILHYLEMKQKKANPYIPARLAIYFNTRVLEGTVGYDSGASIRNAIKAVVRWGFCNESLWPYDISKFKVPPSKQAYGAMWHERVTQYQSVYQDLYHLKSVLAGGNLFTFGFTVYESFESQELADTGVMPMPKPSEQVLGGHCVTAVGYDDTKSQFIIRNSWGDGWGEHGYFRMPYDFISRSVYSSDFWVISQIP